MSQQHSEPTPPSPSTRDARAQVGAAAVPVPELVAVDALLPSEPLLLMGAGPVPIPHAVARANGVVINHLGETMDRVIARLKQMAGYAFQTRSDSIIGVAGPASAAMEMAMANLLWPGRRALVLETGVFSTRLGEMAEAVGAEVEHLEFPVATPIDPGAVEARLSEGRFDVVAMVHGETSSGVVNPVEEVTALAKRYGALVVVDAVVTLGTTTMDMDAWGVDVAITGGQKGLASIPGVSMLAFSHAAWQCLSERTAPRAHWCLDAIRAQRFWGEQQYHYTAPVPGILAMYESLRLLCEEGLPARLRRHAISSRALQAGLEAMGMRLFVPEAYRLDCVVAIEMPNADVGAKLRASMVRDYGVEISGSFGLDIVRIGQMGEQCRAHNAYRTLHALGMCWRALGGEVNLAQGLAAFEGALEREL